MVGLVTGNLAHNLVLQPLPHVKICQCLTVLDYIEVFLELSACQSGGEQWRWLVIICVHIIK